MSSNTRRYWDVTAHNYQQQTRISCTDFHYGPLLPGDSQIGLLPHNLDGMKCLELGAGAAQNSIYLASRGASLCVAVDLSGRQLQVARQLARNLNLRIELVQGDMEYLPFRSPAMFDLVHSIYALPFVDDQKGVIQVAASYLRPGGILLLSTAHPLANAEWLTVDEDENGVFLQNYFVPPVDARIAQGEDAQDGGISACCPTPASHVFGWLREAGLEVLDFLEPEPVPIGAMSDQSIRENVPYDSPQWRERHEELTRIPAVAVFRARKPKASLRANAQQ